MLLSNKSTLGNVTFGLDASTAGAVGDINIKVTKKLIIIDSMFIIYMKSGSGTGGEVDLNATEFVEIVGVEPSNFLPSTLSVLTLGEGTAGNLRVNTPRLIVGDGGRVSATTFGRGNAGSVTINAGELVEVRGMVPGSVNPSQLDSSADVLDPSLQLLLPIPPVPTGDTGELTINTPFLRVADGGLVGVQHEGTGNAGALRINAGSVLLEGGGSITAASASGLGGNISLDLGDSLLLRNSSNITAEAGGRGDGGNLTVNAGTMVLLRNSTIDANAFEGAGGNIRITTQGLFPSADSAITASSRLGVDGTVEVEGLDSEASKVLVQLSNNLPDLTASIASGCEEFAGSEYIVTGRGGLPPTPSEAIALSEVWQDTRGEGNRQEARGRREERGNRQEVRGRREEIPNSQLVEATGWVRRPDGGIELVANMEDARSSWHQFPNCHNN